MITTSDQINDKNTKMYKYKFLPKKQIFDWRSIPLQDAIY